jgi:hypothetical protein
VLCISLPVSVISTNFAKEYELSTKNQEIHAKLRKERMLKKYRSQIKKLTVMRTIASSSRKGFDSFTAKGDGWSQKQKVEIAGMFKLFCTDNADTIGLRQLQLALASMGGLNITNFRLKKLIESEDTDFNGRIDSQEFENILWKLTTMRAFNYSPKTKTSLLLESDSSSTQDSLGELEVNSESDSNSHPYQHHRHHHPHNNVSSAGLSRSSTKSAGVSSGNEIEMELHSLSVDSAIRPGSRNRGNHRRNTPKYHHDNKTPIYSPPSSPLSAGNVSERYVPGLPLTLRMCTPEQLLVFTNKLVAAIDDPARLKVLVRSGPVGYTSGDSSSDNDIHSELLPMEEICASSSPVPHALVITMLTTSEEHDDNDGHVPTVVREPASREITSLGSC